MKSKLPSFFPRRRGVDPTAFGPSTGSDLRLAQEWSFSAKDTWKLCIAAAALFTPFVFLSVTNPMVPRAAPGPSAKANLAPDSGGRDGRLFPPITQVSGIRWLTIKAGRESRSFPVDQPYLLDEVQAGELLSSWMTKTKNQQLSTIKSAPPLSRKGFQSLNTNLLTDRPLPPNVYCRDEVIMIAGGKMVHAIKVPVALAPPPHVGAGLYDARLHSTIQVVRSRRILEGVRRVVEEAAKPL
jgi:hypothetical protein